MSSSGYEAIGERSFFDKAGTFFRSLFSDDTELTERSHLLANQHTSKTTKPITIKDVCNNSQLSFDRLIAGFNDPDLLQSYMCCDPCSPSLKTELQIFARTLYVTHRATGCNIIPIFHTKLFHSGFDNQTYQLINSVLAEFDKNNETIFSKHFREAVNLDEKLGRDPQAGLF